MKDFNQHFIIILTKFTIENSPLQSLAIEYYTSSLIPSIGMFVKWDGKDTLARNFEEVDIVEKELSSYDRLPIF
jgi:hypothetical protein